MGQQEVALVREDEGVLAKVVKTPEIGLEANSGDASEPGLPLPTQLCRVPRV